MGTTSEVSLDTGAERIEAGQEAAEAYVDTLESIRDELSNDDTSGSTLGTMVAAQLQMTEAETQYQVEVGLPKKVSNEVKGVAAEIKKAGGG